MKGDHLHAMGTCLVADTPEGPRPAGTIGQLREGQPIPPGAEILRPLGGRCYESLGPAVAAAGGPAQVATEAYRAGYDRIFGRKAEVGQA